MVRCRDFFYYVVGDTIKQTQRYRAKTSELRIDTAEGNIMKLAIQQWLQRVNENYIHMNCKTYY